MKSPLLPREGSRRSSLPLMYLVDDAINGRREPVDAERVRILTIPRDELKVRMYTPLYQTRAFYR